MLIRLLGAVLLLFFAGFIAFRAKFGKDFSPIKLRHLMSLGGLALCGLAMLTLTGPRQSDFLDIGFALWLLGTVWQFGVLFAGRPRRAG